MSEWKRKSLKKKKLFIRVGMPTPPPLLPLYNSQHLRQRHKLFMWWPNVPRESAFLHNIFSFDSFCFLDSFHSLESSRWRLSWRHRVFQLHFFFFVIFILKNALILKFAVNCKYWLHQNWIAIENIGKHSKYLKKIFLFSAMNEPEERKRKTREESKRRSPSNHFLSQHWIGARICECAICTLIRLSHV